MKREAPKRRNFVHKHGVQINRAKVEQPKTAYTRKRKHKSRPYDYVVISDIVTA